jgi:hypothetical protein
VTVTTWELEQADKDLLAEVFGPSCLIDGTVDVTKKYDTNVGSWSIPIDERKVVAHLLAHSGLTEGEKKSLSAIGTTAALHAELSKAQVPTDGQTALKGTIEGYRDKRASLRAIDILAQRLPKFLYSSSYDRMPGKVSVHMLKQPRNPNQVRPTEKEERIFNAFLDLAGITVQELEETQRLEELTAKLEAASNSITDQIFEYWSQNTSLEIKVKAQPGLPQDPPPFNAGTVVEARVENRIHRMTVPFSERSAGFIWFFSFLVLFSQIREEQGPVILLLDEPGLNLHAKAQHDLLRFIAEKLAPHHQVVYTTHSPFMVPAENLASVRTVEDVLIERRGKPPESVGTKVSDDVLSVGGDTLFPLQAALGYELSQTLFVGKNVLLVEGPSDILYLQSASAALKRRGRTGLDPRWVICPTGGIDKIHTFVSLFSGSKLNIAVLADFVKADRNKIENLRKSGILAVNKIFLATDFAGQDEADIEDWLGGKLLCEIVNAAYELPSDKALDSTKIAAADKSLRRVKQVEACFRTLPATIPEFDHFTPSSWLIQHPEALDGKDEDTQQALGRFEVFFSGLNKHL